MENRELREQLHRVADRIADYRDGLAEVRVTATAGRSAVRASLPTELNDEPIATSAVVDELVAAAAPGVMATAGPRYLGFVVGGSLDAALLGELIATGWDQNAFNEALAPAAIAFEEAAGAWLKDLLGIPARASVGFVTGGQAANTVGLAAGRWHVLHRAGWDVGRDGLRGAPPLHVVAGAERHGTLDRALRLLGLGESAVVEVPARADGAMDVSLLPDALALLGGEPVIVCAQSGNVNTGACDDLNAIADAAERASAWVHVDGAFGLWAAASRRRRHLVAGVERADSWGCDGHKWLNVPYDSGYAFCAHPDVHATSMAYTAAYLTGQVAGRTFGGGDLVPESSRRARGFATWAALRSLGRTGVEDLVDRCCDNAVRCAAGLAEARGVEVANEVVLNQVLARVGDTQTTDRVAEAIQDEGVCWLGATTWGGERLLRLSFSNWSTTADDVDRVVAAVARAVA